MESVVMGNVESPVDNGMASRYNAINMKQAGMKAGPATAQAANREALTTRRTRGVVDSSYHLKPGEGCTPRSLGKPKSLTLSTGRSFKDGGGNMRNELTVSGNVATWNMTVSGGELPKGFEVKLDVRCTYTDGDTAWLTEVAFSGSSVRVRLQSQLRTWKTAELNELTLKGFDCTASRIKAHAYNKGSKKVGTQMSFPDRMRMIPKLADRIEVMTIELKGSKITKEQIETYARELGGLQE